MSERETRIQPQSFTAIGGMNERLYLTEIGPQDWVSLIGVFPEWNGIQSRLWGKRTLAKYSEAIYGIHQFWTPYGYAGGLYQFENTLDDGDWLTPTTRIDLDPLEPPSDRRGYTVDDFGNPWDVGDWGTGDQCVLSFLNGGTDHSACNIPVDRNGPVDDSNGGPAGGGRRCAWVEEVADYPIATFMSSRERAAGIPYLNQALTLNVTANPDKIRDYGCNQSMGAPPPLGGDASFGAYTPVTLGSILFKQLLYATLIFSGPTNPLCDFNQNFTQSGGDPAFTSNDRCVLNFAALQDSANGIVGIRMLGVANLTDPIEVALPIGDFTADFPIDARSYKVDGPITHADSLTSQRVDNVSFSTIRIVFRRRVCA